MPDDLRDQFPIVREIIGAFGIPIYQLEGYEADDLIATLVRQAEDRGIETTIVSGDLDLLQLVSDQTTLMTTRGGVQQTAFYDPAKVMERYGLRPEQMVDFKALKGDTTDNIPGIAGVGEKTAAKLVQDCGSLDGIYSHIAEVQPEKLRAQGRGQPRRRIPLARPGHGPSRCAGRARPRAGAPGQLRPRRGPAPVPRVRVPLARRAPAGHDRRGSTCAGRSAAPGRPQRPDPGGPGCRPAVGRATSRDGPPGAGGGMQLSLDLAAPPPRRRTQPMSPEAPETPDAPAVDGNGHRVADAAIAVEMSAANPPSGARERLAAMLRDPSLADRFEDAADVGAWLARQAGSDHRRRADRSPAAARRAARHRRGRRGRPDGHCRGRQRAATSPT